MFTRSRPLNNIMSLHQLLTPHKIHCEIDIAIRNYKHSNSSSLSHYSFFSSSDSLVRILWAWTRVGITTTMASADCVPCFSHNLLRPLLSNRFLLIYLWSPDHTSCLECWQYAACADNEARNWSRRFTRVIRWLEGFFPGLNERVWNISSPGNYLKRQKSHMTLLTGLPCLRMILQDFLRTTLISHKHCTFGEGKQWHISNKRGRYASSEWKLLGQQ